MSNKCKVCNSETTELFDTQLKVTYDVCHHCDFITKQEEHILVSEEEKGRYDQHNNSEGEGYINIFKNILKLHVRPLKNVKNVLDFGSGPYPMLKTVFEKEGYEVDIFDLYYHNNRAFKNNTYDLITSTEVFEHLRNPLDELEDLLENLKVGGYLLLMTLFNKEDIDFLTWWYRRDPTHISFFNLKTFDYIASKYNLKIIEHNNKNIIVFQKQ